MSRVSRVSLVGQAIRALHSWPLADSSFLTVKKKGPPKGDKGRKGEKGGDKGREKDRD